VHIGRRKAHVNMNRYVWKRRDDGVYIINLEKTWAKLILAARILVTIKDPSDICVMSTRTFGQRGAIKFAQYTGATAMVGKWVPGTFTNYRLGRHFKEPRILIVDDPQSCFAALRETSYTGCPVIALQGTDNNCRFVDCAIPCNNRGRYSIGLMFWLLTRELLRMRGKSDHECIRSVPWKESVDLFFHRSAEEVKRQQEAKARKLEKAAAAQQMQFTEEVEEDLGYGQMEEYEEQPQYEDVQQPVDQYDAQYDNMPPQQDWDMPQGQEIEDWDQPAQGGQDMGYDQQQYDQYDQPPQQQQQQQGADPSMGYVEQDNQAMGMQNW